MSGILIGIVSGVGEKVFVSTFIGGAADLMGVGLVIGISQQLRFIYPLLGLIAVLAMAILLLEVNLS